jgi:hypothetical protein
VYEHENVVVSVAPTARVARLPLTVHLESVIVKLVIGTLPVFVTSNV